METEKIKASPFLRWAGGKKWFIKHLPKYLPKKINNYHEIFLGSGSTFFSLSKELYNSAYISDVNEDLINAYIQIRDNSDELVRLLKSFTNSEKFYYEIRDKHFEDDPIFRAARMIYLNRTGFNGIYRVNSAGKFNVPYGHRKNVDYITADNLFHKQLVKMYSLTSPLLAPIPPI